MFSVWITPFRLFLWAGVH